MRFQGRRVGVDCHYFDSDVSADVDDGRHLPGSFLAGAARSFSGVDTHAGLILVYRWSHGG